MKKYVRFIYPLKFDCCEEAGGFREPQFSSHGYAGENNDIFQFLLRLKQSQKILLTLVQYDDLISHIFFQKEELRRVNRRIMGHRLHIVYELQQHPDSQDNALIGLCQRVKSAVITVSNICDPHVSLEVIQNLFRSPWRLAQHPEKLCLGQGTILREPFDHMGFIFKQQMITPLKVLRC